LIALLAACSSSGRRGGGYYLDDGPDAVPPANLDAVPDAVPKIEPFVAGTSKPYVVFGKTYTPDLSGGPYKAQGRASWYGRKFHGNATATGERYNMYTMTAAHPTLPLPSYARVTRVSTGKSVVVRVNDRGPFLNDRVIDLSYVAAYKLGMLGPGSAEVIVERITPDQIRNWQSAPAPNNFANVPEAAAPVIASSIPSEPRAPASNRLIEPTPLPPPPAAPVQLAAAPSTPANTMSTSLQSSASSTTAVAPNSMFLQLGAFADASKAHALAARISSQIPAELGTSVRVDQNASNLYRVRIGPFASRDAAVQAVSPIQTSTGVAPSLSPP
jgi:rare lipoprotein A